MTKNTDILDLIKNMFNDSQPALDDQAQEHVQKMLIEISKAVKEGYGCVDFIVPSTIKHKVVELLKAQGFDAGEYLSSKDYKDCVVVRGWGNFEVSNVRKYIR